MDLSERDMEIIEKGTKALIAELGYSGFLKYISRVQTFNGDYFRAKEEICKGSTGENNKIKILVKE